MIAVQTRFPMDLLASKKFLSSSKPGGNLCGPAATEYKERKRLSGAHFHDEIMLCRRAFGKVSIRKMHSSEVKKFLKGYPGPDPPKLWIDDWSTSMR